jgi:hypothetical protein
MAKAALSQILIGPFGLHAFCAVLLVLFVGFLWLFNFTAFFSAARRRGRSEVAPRSA